VKPKAATPTAPRAISRETTTKCRPSRRSARQPVVMRDATPAADLLSRRTAPAAVARAVGAAVREATPTYATGDAEALTVPGHVLLAISADDYGDAHVRRFAKRIMRRALAPHLGGRGLNSRSLFREQDAS
jgi:recombinational DNA repair protein (RecF pathway)